MKAGNFLRKRGDVRLGYGLVQDHKGRRVFAERQAAKPFPWCYPCFCRSGPDPDARKSSRLGEANEFGNPVRIRGIRLNFHGQTGGRGQSDFCSYVQKDPPGLC